MLKKILLIIVAVAVVILAAVFLALNNSKVQARLAQHIAAVLSSNLGNHISTGTVRVSWFNMVTVQDLLVTDVRGDTVLSVPKLTCCLNMFAMLSRNVEVHSVILHRADVRLAIDPDTDLINIKFIIDKIKSKDANPDRPKWNFAMQSVELNDCRFSFKNPSKTFNRAFGMDYADVNVSNIDMSVSDFHVGDNAGEVEFCIRRLSCVEKCGLEVNSLSADFMVNSNTLSFKNTNIHTSLSDLEAEEVSFLFNSFHDFGGDSGFISKVNMIVDIVTADVAFDDLSYFAPYFSMYPDKVKVNGKVTGTVENMKGEGINVLFGDMTRINGNFDLKGLPEIRSTLIYADVSDFVTCPQDIERVQIPNSPDGHIHLPVAIHQFSAIGFKGNFTGFFDDFVTYGTFTTNLGNLSTDVYIRPVTGNNDTTFAFRGSLKTERFNLGKLLTQPSIGEINMAGMIEGSASDFGNVHAAVKGNIGSIYVKDYEYCNIDLVGAVNNRMYNGKLSINEPNLAMDFSGKVDMTEVIPSYDFLANVERARLHNLKLVKTDTSSFVSFNVKAAFSGNNIDNLSGELALNNSLFRRNNREIKINDLLIFTETVLDTNQFVLRSDILDAKIRGQYQFMKLPESFFSTVKNFAPAWIHSSASPDSLSRNNFSFDVQLKETGELTGFFADKFRLARDTRIEGVYNPAYRDVHFVLDVPFMRLGELLWQGLYVNGRTADSVFLIESGCAAFRTDKNMSLENLSMLVQACEDSAKLDISWNNWDSLLYRGYLDSRISFRKKPDKKIPLIEICSSHGQLVIANDIWRLTHNGIIIDSTSVNIDDFRALKDNQEILVSGVISHGEQDELEIAVRDFNLSVLNRSLQFDKLLFGGITNGSASLSNLYGVPVFVSDILIDDFSLNNNLFGSTELTASWNSINRSVRIEAESLLNDLRTMLVRGNYNISGEALDFDVFLESVPVKILQPYLKNIFTGLEGTISSEIKLTGAINNPLMNGTIEMRRAALTLDYTKTRYKFEGITTVRNNSILLNGIELFDRFNNSCKITDGKISIDRFRNITFDLQFRANNMEVLNTAERDNSLFYGNAFATGNVHIKGNPMDTQLDINARTERNTLLNIPLSSSDEVSETTFITFVDHTQHSQTSATDRQQNQRTATEPDEPVSEASFAVNINMNVTQDAEVRLIFDAKIGDIMRARGSGNLTLNIANNRFDMAGTYIVDEGDYLFTLRNILSNKHFSIEKGGTMTWDGDPLGAVLNLKAIYTARPSLYDLMKEENFKRSVPVECILHITDRLTNPNIRFELNIPNASQEVRSFLNATTSSEEEMAQQFIMLVAANRFFFDPNQAAQSRSSNAGVEMGLTAASEVLTSQLSYMLSQLSDKIDVDISVRPGTYNTGQIYEGGVSTDRWNFRANYEVSDQHTENIGEFTFDVKVSNSNKIRFKVFNRANATYLSQNSYTQGVGLLFREDFNQLKDLFKRKKSPATRREDETEED